ncbi:hypothetical protein B0H14DRAFT_2827597 [Mycena olivaceomarginata]|nr:hypothetical protein B0H14DRAFT_2827597 [Mycena olivaceomarginata]
MWITGSRSDVLLPFDFDFERIYTYAPTARVMPESARPRAVCSSRRAGPARGVLERDGESMRAARSRGARGEDSTERADLLVLSGRAPHPHPGRTWMSCTGLASLRIDLSRALRLSSPLLSSAAIPARSPPPARTLARTCIDRTSYRPVPGMTCTAATPRSVLYGVPALRTSRRAAAGEIRCHSLQGLC